MSDIHPAKPHRIRGKNKTTHNKTNNIMKYNEMRKDVNLKPYDMWTDEDYEAAIPEETRRAFDRAANTPEIQEKLAETVGPGPQERQINEGENG